MDINPGYTLKTGPTYWERYRSRLKATFVVCSVLNVIGSLIRLGAGPTATLLFSPSLGADIQWAMLTAVQLVWGAVYALPINLLVAAFPVRAPKHN